MKTLFQNPLTIWLSRFLKAKFLEFKQRKNHLKIGYLSTLDCCSFGSYNTIYDFVLLNQCTLGDFTYIASGTKISRTNIGKFCSIGPGCKIGLGKHPSGDFVSTHPIFFSTAKQSQISFADRDYFDEFEEIHIGNDVWLGANVVVIDGVTIGDGVIVTAGSVVTKDIPSYTIAGGVPAGIIRYRFKKTIIERLSKLKWWDMEAEFLKSNFQKFHNIEDLLTDPDE